MKKNKSIVLLAIIGVIMAFLIVMTFARFPMGVKTYNSIIGAIDTDYDVSGGTAYTVKLADDNTEFVEDINEVISVIEDRLDALGYDNYSVKALRTAGEENEDYSLRIETKAPIVDGREDLTTLDEDIAVATQYGVIEFFGGTEANPTNKILQDMEVIESAKYAGMTKYGNVTYFGIDIKFTQESYDALMKLINGGTYYLDAKLNDTTLLGGSNSGAISEDSFDGRTLSLSMSTSSTSEATVNTMIKSVKRLALQINSGGIAYKYDAPERVGSVSSPYGKNVGLFSAISIGALVVLAMVALIIIFKGFGITSALSIILFEIIELAMLIAVPGIRLSVGGIVGIAFATLLCIDGFVITAKRIKEEHDNGKTVKASIKTGFKRSVMPIVNSSVVLEIVCLLLLAFADGVVKNFAITLGIGVVVSMIATLLFARMFVSLMLPLAKNKENFLGFNKEA